MKPRPNSERWSLDAIKEMIATPDVPNPKDERQREPRNEGTTETKKRDFRITDAVLDKYGETPGRVGCQAKLEGKGQRGHTKDCRDRIEKAMAAAEDDLERLVDRDLRLDRYKKKAPVPPAKVEEEGPVPAQQPEASSSSNEVPTSLQVGTTRERDPEKEESEETNAKRRRTALAVTFSPLGRREAIEINLK